MRVCQSANKRHICEYIGLENCRMNKYKYDESNCLWYELKEDYYFPGLTLQKSDNKPIGIVGRSTSAICRSPGRLSTHSC